MNNDNQTNQNQNNIGGMDATSLGAAPAPTPVPASENLAPTPEVPTPQAPQMPENPVPNTTPSMSASPSVAPDLANPVMVNPGENPNPNGEVLNPGTTPVNPTPVMGETNPQATPITNNPSQNLDPIAQPIPGTNQSIGGMNVNSNGFVESQKMQNVGTDVPNKPDKGKKKGMSKVLFIIIIIILLAAIAYGVYYYLNLGNTAKSKISVTPKNIEIEINQPLSTNLADYATFNGTDSKNCRLITSNVDITTPGTYEYSITCGKDTFKGNVVVINNTTLNVNTKTVYATILAEGATNNNVTVDKFVHATSCTGSDCTYAFGEGFDLNTSLKTAGSYSVPIIVTDGSGTTAIVNANLRVFDDLKVFTNCRNEETKITDKFAIKADNTFAGYAVRTQEFSFATDEEYQAAVGSKGETITYNNITGKATYDDQNRILTIETELTSDTLNTETGGTFPADFVGINTYYSNKAYTCTIGMDNIVNP